MPPRYEPVDWYDAPRLYDIVFDVDTRPEVDFLERLHARHGRSRGKRALEPACGSGRLVHELARRGWSVAGFDLSRPMVEYAARRVARRPKARVFEAHMEDFATRGRFDLAHCLVSTFKYVTSESGARRHLENVAASLARGGIYVLGLHLSEYAWRRPTRERWVGERGGTHVVCNITGWPPNRRRRVERVRARLISTEGGVTRRYQSEWDFRTYDARQLRALLASVPALDHVATYDFGYDERELDDEQLDVVLVLRRR
jgi:SAM-dependent methyltransferase